MRFANYRWMFCGLGLTVLALLGCGPGLPDADQGVEEGILLLGNGSEPRTLDPHIATGTVENRVISSLMEGLINYHLTDDSIPEPGVAKRWEANADASAWTFFLREDARWSNGDPVTAEDFAYGFERILTPALGSEYAEMLHVIKGAAAFHRGETEDFATVGVEVIDAHTLRITLVGPMPNFPVKLNHYSWFPVHRPTIEAHGGMTDRSGRWTRLGNYVGNGPFVLSGWRPNQYIKVMKSETYWDHETVRLNGIVFFPIEDENTELRMFDAGRLHYTNNVPSNEIPRLREQRPDLIRLDPYMGTYFFRLNVTRPPLDKVEVRRALAWAIDREVMAERVTLGDEIPSKGYVPDMFSDYTVQRYVGLDPEKARALLAEAGHAGGAGIPPLDLLYNTMDGHRKIAEALASMWREHLGIEVRPFNKEWKVYLDDQVNLNYTISRSGWIADYPDPMSFLDKFTTGNGNNNTGWSNLEYDALIEAARREGDGDRRLRLLEEAESILMSEMPVIPLYHYTRKYLLDPRVRNWFPKTLDNRPLKYIYLE